MSGARAIQKSEREGTVVLDNLSKLVEALHAFPTHAQYFRLIFVRASSVACYVDILQGVSVVVPFSDMRTKHVFQELTSAWLVKSHLA